MTKNLLAQSVKLAASCSMLAISGGVSAQNSDDSDFALEEIIVTAQRREQSLQDVPISVSTLQGDRINEFAAGGTDIRLLSARIPGLNAESSNGRVAPRFYLRGLGNTDFDLIASQPVSIIMDDVVMENVVHKSFPLFDLERVEVLRGPQGTLFGRNTPAGIIKFESRKPTQEPNGYFTASYGSFGQKNLEGAFGQGVSDTVSFRLSAMLQDRNDYIDNDFLGTEDALGGYNEKAARAQVLYETDNFDALAMFQYRDIEGTSALFRANVLDRGSNELNNNFIRDTVFFSDDHNNPQEYENWGASLRMNYRFGNEITLTSITAYLDADGVSLGDIDGGNPTGPGFIPFPSTTAGITDNAEQFTQELRLSQQATDEIFWQGGFFYFNSVNVIGTDPGFVDPTFATHENEAWALFGQVAFDLSEETTITVGARYTDDQREMRSKFPGFGGGAVRFTRDVEADRLSWDIAVNHNATDDISVYARVASGFRAPTIQGRDIAFGGNPSVASEETIISYEAGFKANLVDNRLRWNGSVFYWDVDDLQISAVGGGGNFISLINAENAVGYGFETEIEYLATEELMLTMGFAYNNTEIKDEDLGVNPCDFGRICTVLDPFNAQGFALVDGNPLPQAPEWTLNLTAEYTKPVGNDGELFMFTDWAFQGRTNFFIYESVEFTSNGDFEGGLRIGYRWQDGKYELALFGRNITNEANIKGGIDFNNLTAFFNEPRVMGAAFRVGF